MYVCMYVSSVVLLAMINNENEDNNGDTFFFLNMHNLHKTTQSHSNMFKRQ